MEIEAVVNQILYVPFGEDYDVDKSIKGLLTEERFFNECFFMPNFDNEIQELLDMSSTEIEAYDIDLTKEELVEKYRNCKTEMGALYAWINNNQKGIYCVKGDAGTGKTTFLHYLKFTKKNISFDIIDIQKARDGVKILRNQISIPKFDTNIYYKTFSAILKNIVDELFISHDDGRIIASESIYTIMQLTIDFSNIYKGYYPRKEIDTFFTNLSSILEQNISNEDTLEKCGDYCYVYFMDLLTRRKHEQKDLIEDAIELYLYIVCCKHHDKKHILVLDNLERFIGTDEIYNKQLTELVDDIRNIQNTIADNNKKLSSKYQIMIFMRNTSSRMFTNQQIAELFPHVVDLSEWFQSSKIVEKKISWYENNGIAVEEAEWLRDIINDIGYCEGNITGLRSKLNMLFNNNKRVVVNILTRVLENPINKKNLEIYDYFRRNHVNIDARYAKFAKRIIIFRLVLNELRKESLFKNIIAQREDQEETSLGYARKILSILYEYKLHDKNGYMELDNIITELDISANNAVERYFLPYDRKKRTKIAKVLYYMNYYDGRADNWLQFIDIQYNISQGNVRISSYSQLEKLIEDNHKNISIKITSAGIAYLYFVICSFEFFSCKSYSVAKNRKEFDDGNLPPVLCVIPTMNEIKEKKCEELMCIKIIDFVSSEAIRCINHMKSDKKNISFRKTIDDKLLSHTNRIINNHVGFINNFIQCMREMYKDELLKDTQFRTNYQNIEMKLEKIREVYLKCSE